MAVHLVQMLRDDVEVIVDPMFGEYQDARSQ